MYQEKDGKRKFCLSRGLGDVKKRQKEIAVEGTPLLIVKYAKSLGALVTTAMNPKSFIAKKRVANAIPVSYSLLTLPPILLFLLSFFYPSFFIFLFFFLFFSAPLLVLLLLV